MNPVALSDAFGYNLRTMIDILITIVLISILFSTFSRAIVKLKMHLAGLVIKSENVFKMREARIFI